MVQIADFIEAPHSGGDYRKVLIVEHLTISPETRGAARGVVANWSRTRSGSTQFVVDNREIIQAVPETAYAWAAGTTANIWGIHIEHCGYLQTIRQWRDGYSTAELELSSALTAELCAKHGIPARRIGPAQIRKAVASGDPADGGICGHIDITHAFPGETTHTDPGRFFPWDRFIDLVTDQLEDTMAFDLMDLMRHDLTKKGDITVASALRDAHQAAARTKRIEDAVSELATALDKLAPGVAAAVHDALAEAVVDVDVTVKKGGQR